MVDARPALICAGVTSSSRLPQSFVLRFLSILLAATVVADDEYIFDERSTFFLCSSATTRIDFLCLKRLSAGAG